MSWQRDASLPNFRPRNTSAALALTACLAGSAVLAWAAVAIAADDGRANEARGSEKLIGTFQIRGGDVRDSQGRFGTEGLRGAERPPSVNGVDPSRQLAPSGRRNFLTGEAAVPQGIEDIFRR